LHHPRINLVALSLLPFGALASVATFRCISALFNEVCPRARTGFVFLARVGVRRISSLESISMMYRGVIDRVLPSDFRGLHPQRDGTSSSRNQKLFGCCARYYAILRCREVFVSTFVLSARRLFHRLPQSVPFAETKREMFARAITSG